MSESFFLDPLEGELPYPEEPIFNKYLGCLPAGGLDYRFAPGRTDIAPAYPLIVSCCYDFRLTYSPEGWDLPPGTVVAFSIPRTWTQPQIIAPGPGFVSAERSSGAPCTVSITQNANLQWWIRVRVDEAAEPRDGFICAVYDNVTIQRFPQDRYENWRSVMQTAVDLAGSGEYAMVPAAAAEKPVILSAPPARFHVVAPAVARPGQAIEVKASALDHCGNRAHPTPCGEVFAATVDDPFSPAASTILQPEDKGLARLRVVVPEDATGSVRISVSNRKDNLYGLGPVTVVDARPETLNVYFGDIHAKTVLTDGLNSPMEYFEHARDVALADFGAIADHNGPEVSRAEGPFSMRMSDEVFSEIQEACEAFNEPGRFVTLQGFEQNEIRGYPGHRNVYFRGVCPGIFRGDTLEELYDFVEGHDALIIPHHSIIWGTRVHLDNPRYERLLEIYSMHCTSELKGSPLNNWATTANKEETGMSAREVLNLGYRVGFIAASDNHNGAPGLSARPSRFTNLTYAGGLAAVMAAELTREAIFDGLQDRRCYATSGARIYLDFRLGGQIMGSEVAAEFGASLPYEITVAGSDRIARVEFVVNGTEEMVWTYDGRDYVHLQGERSFSQRTNWIYLRVTQIDRHIAWSSPIWVDMA